MIRQILAKGLKTDTNNAAGTNETTQLQEEIEFNIIYGYDRKKKRKRKSDSTESSSEMCTEGCEKFDNEEELASSPLRNPNLDPSKIEAEELEQEMGSRNVTRPSTYRQLALLISCVTLLRNNLVFMECFFNSGGIFFLVPYFIVLFVFGVPMAIFELSLAQFSSIPMNGMFVRMAPVLGGIPYLTLALRIIYTVYVAFDPRFLLYAYQCFITVITGNDDWIHCEDYVGVRCFDPTISCKVNEFLVNGMCVKDLHFTDLPKHQDFGLLTYFGFRDQRLVSLIPAQIFKEINDLDTKNHILVALAYLLISGFITYKGRQFFASIAGFFAFLPIVGLIPAVVLFYYDVGSRKKNFLKEILSNNDISKIFQMSAWLDAASVTIRTLYIADGTLMTLGSMADFRHNFVKDAILLAAFGAAYRILLCFGILPIFYAGNDILYPFSNDVHAEGEKIQFHAVELLFSALPSYSIPGIGPTIQFFVYALLFGTLNFAAIAYQVITLEILTNSLHHVFPRLLYLKEKIVRICIILAAVIYMLYFYISYLPGKEGLVSYKKEREIDTYFDGFISVTVLTQLVAVSIVYGYKRLLINILTMLKHHSRTYKLVEKCRFFLYAMWAIILPAVSVYSLITIIVRKYQIYNSFNVMYAGVNAIPLIYFVRKLIFYLIHGEYVSNLSQTHRWQPANEGHAREVEHDERASGVLN